MPQPIQLHKRETLVRDVFVQAIHTEADFLHVQIYDYTLRDALDSFMFDRAMTETEVIERLDEITSTLTEKTIDNLFTRYLLNQYVFYKKLGEVSDLQEFIMVFKKELEERIESKNEKN